MIKHQRLLDPDHAPRDGFPYKDADTLYDKLRGKTLAQIIEVATLHRTTNGLPVPEDFAFVVETQICQGFPGRCVNRDGSEIDLSCIHRGELVRYEGCDSCGGVRAKIMACAIFGECTLFRKETSVQACSTCLQRVPISS